MTRFSALMTSETSERRDSQSEAELDELPTVRTASAISQKVLSKPLDRRQKEAAQPTVHYAFGAFVGAVYGVLSGRLPGIDSGRGVAYGTAVWLAADEAALPALRLSEPPARIPVSTHASALAAHWVYAAVLDAASGFFRSLQG